MLLTFLTEQNLASAADLTTLAAARRYLQLPGRDVEQNELIQELIARASRAILMYTGREFAPTSGPVARSFLYTGGDTIDLAPFDLRAATSVVLDSDQPTGSQIVLTGEDYLLGPVTARDGVYQYLTLRHRRAGWHTHRREQILTITGYWGWSAVPADVEMAAIIAVREWLRPSSAFNTTFPSDAPPARPVALPYAAQDLLAPYRTPVIA